MLTHRQAGGHSGDQNTSLYPQLKVSIFALARTKKQIFFINIFNSVRLLPMVE